MKPWPWAAVERERRYRLARKPPLETPSEALNIQCPRTRRRVANATALAAAFGLFAACFPPEEERLSCDDVYAPGSFDYGVLEALILEEEVGTSKGCMGAPCHSAGTQRGGVRLDTPELIYDELSTRPDTYYEALSSGYMPHDGIPWDAEELKIFRSWYCAGAFPP